MERGIEKEVENMTHYAICSDDKCYSEVYTKEEINIMLNGKIGTLTGIGQFDVIEGRSRAEVVINLDDIDVIPLGVINFKMNGAGFENVIVDTFYVEQRAADPSKWCVRLGAYNADYDRYTHIAFQCTVLYMKQYE